MLSINFTYNCIKENFISFHNKIYTNNKVIKIQFVVKEIFKAIKEIFFKIFYNKSYLSNSNQNRSGISAGVVLNPRDNVSRLDNSNTLMTISTNFEGPLENVSTQQDVEDSTIRSIDFRDPIEMQSEFDEFLANPSLFLTPDQGGRRYLKGTSFYECACNHYSRLKNNFRLEAENVIINDVNQRIENKNDQLNLASLGSGGLLQDLVILGKLIQKGFKNINILLVDYELDPSNAEKLQSLLNQFPGVTVAAKSVPFIGKKNPLDAIYSIDFDDLNKSDGRGWAVIFEGKQALKETGKFYLFGDNTKVILGKNNDIKNLMIDTDAEFASLRLNSQFSRLHSIQKFSLISTKGINGNFKHCHIARVIQFLFNEFNQPIHIDLYAQKLPSAYILQQSTHERILKNLSGIDQITVSYHPHAYALEGNKKSLNLTDVFINMVNN